MDVDYREHQAVAACVLFRDWADATSAEERIELLPDVQPYEPGQFYRRELPSLLAVLQQVAAPLQAVLIDGYVWLDDEQTPGLGGHLWDALGRTVPVIGVAKTRYRSATTAVPVMRGESARPLFVTAAGIEPAAAGQYIQDMHGPYRIPTLLKRVDQLCRQAGRSEAS